MFSYTCWQRTNRNGTSRIEYTGNPAIVRDSGRRSEELDKWIELVGFEYFFCNVDALLLRCQIDSYNKMACLSLITIELVV